MRRELLATAAALVATPLMALPVWASACVTASVATYEAGGFSCTVDGGAITFSDIVVVTTGLVTLTDFAPFVNSTGTEYGLTLFYTANANFTNPTADVGWQYNVSGNLLEDAYMAFVGTTTNGGIANLAETLSPISVTLSLAAPGSTSTTFAPVGSLSVLKDQDDFADSEGATSSTSAVTNAFSLTSTPIPGTLPLLATGLAGLFGFRRKQRKQGAVEATALAS
jgi:hypothetical protein